LERNEERNEKRKIKDESRARKERDSRDDVNEKEIKICPKAFPWINDLRL